MNCTISFNRRYCCKKSIRFPPKSVNPCSCCSMPTNKAVLKSQAEVRWVTDGYGLPTVTGLTFDVVNRMDLPISILLSSNGTSPSKYRSRRSLLFLQPVHRPRALDDYIPPRRMIVIAWTDLTFHYWHVTLCNIMLVLGRCHFHPSVSPPVHNSHSL